MIQDLLEKKIKITINEKKKENTEENTEDNKSNSETSTENSEKSSVNILSRGNTYNSDNTNNTENTENEENESNYNNKNLFIKAIFEFFAALFFSFSIAMSGNVNNFIFAFLGIKIIFGPLSGGHLNPAVTLSFYLYEFNRSNYKKGLKKLLFYWIAQFLGVFFGGLMASIFDKFAYININDIWYRVFLSEFLFTGIFCFVIIYFNSKITGFQNSNDLLNSIFIAHTLFYGINAGKNISNGLNPAITIIFNLINFGNRTFYPDNLNKNLVFSILGQILGSIFFLLIFKFIVESYVKKDKESMSLSSSLNKEKDFELSMC
jgi:glycerol uptake facilitator-like aquaporin